MNSGESFKSSNSSSGEKFSEWFEEPSIAEQPGDDLTAEEIIKQLIAERHRPADPKIVYPEIFDDRYSGDISPECRSALESFDKADFFDLLDAYKVDLRLGNRRLIGFLTKMLGLNKRPNIIYREKTGDLEGEFFIDKKKKDPYIIFYYQPGENEPDYEECVSVIAHEMWHAYQEERRHDGDVRGDLYDANYRHYIDSDDDEKGYFNQLVEQEANWLGYGLRNKMREMTSEKEDIVTKFKRLKSFDKRHGIQS